MCKIVYLTRRAFNRPAKRFINALAYELRKKNVEVVTSNTNLLRVVGKRHRMYGIAIAIDFFNDGASGGGLTLNRRSSKMSRLFASYISNDVDRVMSSVFWRNFTFVDSDDKYWYRYFNNVSSEIKVVFHLCTINNVDDANSFYNSFDDLVKSFASEIIRCLRSNYKVSTYIKSAKIAKRKLEQLNKIKKADNE